MSLIDLSTKKEEKSKYLIKLFYGSSGMRSFYAETLEDADQLAKEKLSSAASGTWVEIVECSTQNTVKTIGKNTDGSFTEIMNKTAN